MGILSIALDKNKMAHLYIASVVRHSRYLLYVSFNRCFFFSWRLFCILGTKSRKKGGYKCELVAVETGGVLVGVVFLDGL